MKIIFLATLVSVIFSYNTHRISAKTIGQDFFAVGQKLETILKSLQQRLQHLQFLHKPCEPCKTNSNVCDCTDITPRKDCLEFHQHGYKIDGLYRLKIPGIMILHVYCDQTTQGGGWTVFQRRQDGSVDFSRKWNDYKIGFGNIKSEFWFGNQHIYDMTKPSFAPKKSQLLINMKMKGKQTQEYVKYNTFEITDEATKYTLKIDGPSGNVTTVRTVLNNNNNTKFSTIDSDNDVWGNNCASNSNNGGGGGWWYKACSLVFLNSPYKFTKSGGQISWYIGKAQPEFVEMKMRRNL